MMPPHCREVNDCIDTRLPAANVQLVPENMQFIVAPFGEARQPTTLIDRVNRRAAARERRLSRQWAPYLQARRMSLAFMRDFSHYFEQIRLIRYLDDTVVQIRQIPRRNLPSLQLELPWPVQQRTDLECRRPLSIADIDNNRLWIWELVWTIVVIQADGIWELRRGEYIACPRRISYRGRVLRLKVVVSPDLVMVGWCIVYS